MKEIIQSFCLVVGGVSTGLFFGGLVDGIFDKWLFIFSIIGTLIGFYDDFKKLFKIKK